ncbi:MAG: ribonucleotide reductase subunit alpha [Gordonibacter pamelaeae]|uniref:Ribonucleotide reductase subunit alpha n=1 Tax=Gordonibacter pamelaeae TaxID=471189 RepID=A0A369M432_9ACTN|nr:ribonucleotide reductase subunit alpha [Gordonibacter pamelaeae]MBS4897232.1 ribonucleotide reductase subunit alpha [Gordonibacter pamelaeae]MCB6313094.1 ribonucleotide reductase subunit alpha [Gordonibacter pamelaeae]RDB66194.1 ribonucleotide reductase subunit alpha [Gordonibacter pamelaeae]HJH75346.1 ribonucleotide reductase subunit alpha [Eggerthellaceae bacterium]
MFENADANSSPSQNDEYDNSAADYLHRAAQACAAGDAVLGMHLYLAAFEKGAHGAYAPDDEAVEGLRQAWALACKLKERSLAEYIFEKLEPYLASDEVAACAEQLQRLALDKLEEFGLTREDLEDMTDMISQDFLGIDAPRLMKVEHVTLPRSPRAALPDPEAAGAAGAGDDAAKAAESAGNAEKGAAAWRREAGGTKGDQGKDASSEHAAALAQAAKAVEDAMGPDADAHAVVSAIERISYADIVGYNDTVALMRDFGLGMQDDPQFQSLVELLNARHGLDRMPAADAILFRSPAREDANRFMAATLGELDMPAIRMRMEENLQGMPVLCVMAQADNQPQLNAARNAFEGPGVLMLEDLDLWASPMTEGGDDFGGFVFSSLSRGAREAIGLIRSAVENPDVFVLASAAEAGEIDPFFFDLLEPLSIVDIDYPTPEERVDIWMEIAREHPSLRGVNRVDLVRLSSGMPRYDIYMAAREAIEEAYKASLVARRYVPVTADNLFDKLAAYQPLDSDEYRALEDAVVRDFRRDLDHLDDLLKGTEE